MDMVTDMAMENIAMADTMAMESIILIIITGQMRNRKKYHRRKRRPDNGRSGKEKSQEAGLIDITEILSDYLRIFRRMWAWVLIFTILGSGFFYIRARVQYQPVYTASATFTVNIQREQQEIADTGSTSFFNNSAAEQMAKTFPYILTSGVLKRKVAKDMDVAAVPGVIKATVQTFLEQS